LPGADPGDLGAAAADVEQQGAPVLAGEQGGAAFHRQLGLLAGGDDAWAQAGLGGGADQEGRAVGGAAAGLGGDGVQAADGAARIRSAQAASAAMVRSIAASDRAPVAARPSPRRTMREKLSTTRKPPRTGAPTSSRQLLVPRSSAAKRPDAASSAPQPRRWWAGADIWAFGSGVCHDRHAGLIPQ
jgi:hypothetical protein